MQLLHRRLHFRSAGAWAPNAGWKCWLSASQSGAVAATGTWADAIGANDATLVGASTIVSTGYGLEPQGGTGTADCAKLASGNLLGASWTLAFWVYQANAGGSRGRWAWKNYTKFADYHSTIDGEYILGTKRANSVYIGTGAWAHLAFRFDGAKYEASVNGAAWATIYTSSTALGNSQVLYFGSSGETDSALPDGNFLDDIFVADSAMSDANVTDIRTNSPGKRG